MIPFNKPAAVGKEFEYMQEALQRGKLSGNGYFTKLCQTFFQERYHFKKTLLTNSCTDALEMAAILCDIKQGDEVIIPSFTFPSCANAFVLRGAKIVFADCEKHSPNIDIESIDKNITSKTKAILVVHYAGVACKMEAIVSIAKKNNLFLVEDCAHSIDSYYNEDPLGSFGDFAAFSFHETKNIQCGEGGMLVVNNSAYFERADIIWEKGTNRVAFYEGKMNTYNWVDIGSSFLMSELQAAYLFGQLENIGIIQQQRKMLWDSYFEKLQAYDDSYFSLPLILPGATNNASMFYLLCKNATERDALITYLRQENYMAVFHYLPLHLSPYYLKNNPKILLLNAERFSASIIRLPFYFELSKEINENITDKLLAFYNGL